MTISVVQVAPSGTSTFSSAVTVGNTVLFVLGEYSAPTVTVTNIELGGSTITGTTQLEFPQTAGGGSAQGVLIAMLPNVQVSGQKAITYTCSGNVIDVYAIEIAGLGASPTMDQAITAVGTGGNIASGTTAATTTAAEFIFGAAANYNGSTNAPTGSSWTTTLNTSDGHLSTAYLIQSTAGATYAYNQTVGGSATGWAVAIVTLKAGTTSITSTGSMSMAPMSMAGTGFEAITSSGSLHMPAMSFSTPVPVTAIGAFTMASMGMAGTVTATIPIVATGAFGMPSWGFVGAESSGAFDLPRAIPNFPAQPLSVKVELNLPVSGWTDISAYASLDTAQITRGHQDESTTVSASTLAMTLDNADGRFSQAYPKGAYYGQLGLNTPIRVSLAEGATYLRSEVDQASFATCPNSSGMNAVTAGFEVWVDATLDNWMGPSQVLASKWAASANQRSWQVGVDPTGIWVWINTTGTSGGTYFHSNGTMPIPPNQRMSIRVTYDGSANVSFYTGQYCAGWTQLGSTWGLGGLGAAHVGTAPVQVGYCSDNDEANIGYQGKIHAFAWIKTSGSGLAGAVASSDFTQIPAYSTSFTDPQSNSWTVNGNAEISNRAYRFHGECAAWPQAWSPGGANATVSLSAGGLLRRIGQGEAPVNSPMNRAYTQLTGAMYPQAYWPMEDLSNATSIASGIPGYPVMQFFGAPTLSSFSSFNCSLALPVLNGATFTGVVPAYSISTTQNTNSDAVVRFLMAVPSAGDTANAVICRLLMNGNATGQLARVDLTYLTGGSMSLTGYDDNGSQLWTSGAVVFPIVGALARVSIEIRNNGSGTYLPSFDTLIAGAMTGNGATVGSGVTGTVGTVRQIQFNPSGSPLLTGTAIGHVSLQSTWASLFTMANPLMAWQGEAAGNRFARLCGEQGLQFRGRGNLSDTVPMGIQTIETITTLLQECADADQAIWFEPRQCLGWGFRTRVSVGNQTAAIPLDYNLDHLSGQLQPTVDDQTVINNVTVQNQSDGSSAQAILTTGPMSNQPPPLGVGNYDTSVTVNLASDSQLVSQAGWILHMKTVNQPRFPGIECDMANAFMQSLWYSVLDADLGDRLTIADPPFWLPPGAVDQIIQGASESLSDKTFLPAWNGIPTLPWNVAYMDDVVYGRADTDGSTLAVADPTGTATTLSIATTNPASPLWTTNSADFPFNIGINGEEITVTNITGSSSPQTFTVTRSVNGVQIAQAAGAAVALFIPCIISL